MVTTVADLAAPPDHVMLDTCVLLTATDEGRKGHLDALRILSQWPTLYISGQIIREYLVVATRPVRVNGLGLSPADALGNVSAFRQRTTVLAENRAVTERLLGLARDAGCAGKQIHDAGIVATMLAHRVGTVVTGNAVDFARFAGYITLVGL
jgi:predicted nucleic acid-binding protein